MGRALGASPALSGVPLVTLSAESSFSIDSVRKCGDQFHFFFGSGLKRFGEKIEREDVCVTEGPWLFF